MAKSKKDIKILKGLVIVGVILLALVVVGYFLHIRKPGKMFVEKIEDISTNPIVMYNVLTDKETTVKLMPEIITTIGLPDREKIVQKNIQFNDSNDARPLKKRAFEHNIKIIEIRKTTIMLALEGPIPTNVRMIITGRDGDKYIFNLQSAKDISDTNFIVNAKNGFFETLARLENDGKKVKLTSTPCKALATQGEFEIIRPTEVRRFGNYILMRYANLETSSEARARRKEIIDAMIWQEVLVKGKNGWVSSKDKQRFENIFIIKTNSDGLIIKDAQEEVVKVTC